MIWVVCPRKGPEKLTKEITQEDFAENANDRKVLESGMFQILSSPDTAGRNVYLVLPFYRPEGVPLISVVSWILVLSTGNRVRTSALALLTFRPETNVLTDTCFS